MNLPRSNKELDKIFLACDQLNTEDFIGEYSVFMLTGYPNFLNFAHRKIFFLKGDKVYGRNVFLKNIRWANHFLEKAICEKPSPIETILINYNTSETAFVFSRIRDYMRKVNDSLYLGRFNYMLGKRELFLGYFSLTKLQEV